MESNSKTKSAFAENIAYARRLRGWTQEEAAVKLGILHSTLGAYEEDRAWVRKETLVKMVEVYQIENVYKFLTDSEYFKIKPPKLKTGRKSKSTHVQKLYAKNFSTQQ